MIIIEEKAKECESFLNHHTLAFDEAKSYSWPALEIKNNEVRCSPAATTKTVTDNDLFYFRTRGISKEVARTTLIESFCNDLAF